MRLLHTADWHLGQTFFGYDRRWEHARFLGWLRAQIVLHRVDVLLIAGDLFDSPNPSAESQKVLYTFIREVTAEKRDLQVIIIAGNHDSAARLEAPNPLLEAMNVTVRGVVRRTREGGVDFDHLTVPIHKGGRCLAVPYIREGDCPESTTYTQGVSAIYQTLFDAVEDKSKPIIAMGHLQATGSEISLNDRAERTVIGGLECISPDAFSKGIAYTALGHLHRAQRVSGREDVRYAGAPLPMSFAEKNNRQGVTLVTVTDRTVVERLEFDAPVKLISLPKEALPLPEVLAELAKLPCGAVDETSPYLQVKVLLTEPEPSLRIELEKALEGKAVRLARLEMSVVQGGHKTGRFSYEELQQIDPVEMAADIFKRRFGGNDMPEAMKGLLLSVIREVGE
jgi:exonuclease SbcD